VYNGIWVERMIINVDYGGQSEEEGKPQSLPYFITDSA
jgi:hypothetical protein